MLLACLWSGLSLGILGCGPFEARALDPRRCAICAPSTASLRSQQKIKERLLHCHAAAAATTATAIITFVVHWLLLRHYVAFPPTSRRCYRSTTNARQVRLIMRLLIWSSCLPFYVNGISKPSSNFSFNNKSNFSFSFNSIYCYY